MPGIPLGTIDSPPPAREQAPLPSPDTFDILSTLYPLLSRLLIEPKEVRPSDQPQADDTLEHLDANGEKIPAPLSPKDFVTAASVVRQKVQKAREAVKDLDGMDVTTKDQEDIIKYLEGEVARQRSELRKMGIRAAQVVQADMSEDKPMTG